MFRLAENLNAIVVHELVREHVLAAGLAEDLFVAPADWAQL
jgi:hypothetical protein